MIEGGCLCGAVRFEIDALDGAFELCHCTRCRKVSGSAFLATIAVRRDAFRLASGAELVHSHELPLVEHPPAFRSWFCGRCGSPVPDPRKGGEWLEIPAGSLDAAPVDRAGTLRTPDRHIFVEHRAPWYTIDDGLPRLDEAELIELRGAARDGRGKGEPE